MFRELERSLPETVSADYLPLTSAVYFKGSRRIIVFTKFEWTILNALLAGELPELSVLRAQAQAATVEERELTGVGFFTTLSIPPEVTRLNAPGRRVITDVAADLAGLTNGAGFLLFIQDGQLDFLEGFTYDEPWPENLELLRWYYLHHAEPGSPHGAGTSERDLGGVASMLADR